MIFISGVISIVFQKNMLCTNKICVIYFCLNCVKFCLKCFIYLVSWRGGEGVASAPPPFPAATPACPPMFKQTRDYIQWKHGKEKPFQQILVYLHIFWHYQAYSGTSQLYSDIFRTLCNCALYEMNTIILLILLWTQGVN